MITSIVIETKSEEHERTFSVTNILNELMSSQGRFNKFVTDYVVATTTIERAFSFFNNEYYKKSFMLLIEWEING
jgi:hypothetical protein